MKNIETYITKREKGAITLNRINNGRIHIILVLGLIFLFTFSSKALLEEKHTPLIKDNEEVIFSFQMKNSDKIMTIATTPTQSYLVYRYGTKDNIELEFPENKKYSWDQFTYSFYFRASGVSGGYGLDLKYLTFKNYSYTYEIYDEYSMQDDSQSIGIRIVNDKTGEEFNIAGDPDTTIGYLDRLQDHKLIETEWAG